jgi:general secretion pathway protein I
MTQFARAASRPGGFTLIEVLVALAIVAIGMAAVLSTLTSSADTLSYLRDKTFAQWVALNQVANVRLTGSAPAVGDTTGDTDFAGRTWHWKQEVVASEVPGVERIDVMVRPADVKAADEDKGWYTTVSGIFGGAVGVANGYLPDWGSQTLNGTLPANGQGTQGTSSTLGVSSQDSSTLDSLDQQSSQGLQSPGSQQNQPSQLGQPSQLNQPGQPPQTSLDPANPQ